MMNAESTKNHQHQTLEYYSQNAGMFISGTLSADMQATHARFMAQLPRGALILDLGCGSGRDTKAFLDMGYQVEAMDGSAELCAKASAYTGVPVKQMLFQDLDAISRYDGIWACASILHLPKAELTEVIGKIQNALVPGGVLYASFKYGEYEGMRKGRWFTDFTEGTLKDFIREATQMEMIDLWTTEDVRADRKDERWINLLAQR